MSALDLSFKDQEQIVKLLQQGKVGVMPTDTIYGLVGSALNPATVEEIYVLRKRDSSKPMIILISSLEDLLDFDIVLTKEQKVFLNKIWPNPVSVILPCPHDRFFYLHRGKKSLAFRMPNEKALLKILQRTGPLVAPSANLEKEQPAQDVSKAKEYFKERVYFYTDGGTLKSTPSTIIRLYEDGTKIVLREGVYKV